MRPRKPEDNNVVVLWVFRIEKIDNYDEDANIFRSKPIHTVERVQGFDGTIGFSRFAGVDLLSVYVHNGWILISYGAFLITSLAFCTSIRIPTKM